MNRIYQGKVTQGEIPDSGILSASNGERTKVRCRNLSPAKGNWLLFHRDTDEARKLTTLMPNLGL